MKTIVTATLALALTGCAGQTPQIVREPYEVKVPVAVPCKVPTIAAPLFAFDTVTPDDDVYVKGRALLAERTQRAAYETELKAALQACQ